MWNWPIEIVLDSITYDNLGALFQHLRRSACHPLRLAILDRQQSDSGGDHGPQVPTRSPARPASGCSRPACSATTRRCNW